MSPVKPDKLHLAASRFERIAEPIVRQIATPEWVHLGEPPLNWNAEIKEQIAYGHFSAAIRLKAVSVFRRLIPKIPAERLRHYYANTTFQEFFFAAKSRLDFPDNTFAFAFAEHFFEHLWFDQATDLLKELHRVMQPQGVIRISVPDADLRTYLPPEPPGYPSGKVPWSHHQKHKIRWNVYTLGQILTTTGFTPRPIMFCDKEGNFHQSDFKEAWMDDLGPDTSTLCRKINYLRRIPSLIVDGVCSK